MGCSASHSNGEDKDGVDLDFQTNQNNLMDPSLKTLLSSNNPHDLLKAFVRLDKIILEEEEKSPSSVFGQAMTRQQQIKAHLQAAIESKNQNELLSEECSIADLFSDLGLMKNPEIAPEHEEFVASINRRALNENAINILQAILDKIEDEIKKSSERISQLQSAYQQQDELLGQIFGENYGSESEKLLEKEVDTRRHYRDILSVGVLQWETCSNDVKKAAKLLQKGVTSWKSLKNESLERKISLATETRNCLQESVLLIQISEELLQDVQFPFCTYRELRSISQTLDYIFTDILIEDSYLNATEMYKKFLQRADSLHEWIEQQNIIIRICRRVDVTAAEVLGRGRPFMNQVFSSKLRTDLLETDQKVLESANELRQERIFLICKKLKIENPSANLVGNLVGNKGPAAVAAVAAAAAAAGGTSVLIKVYGGEENRREDERILDYDKFPVNLESKLGLTRSRSPPGNSELQTYFQKVLENRKNTMWPSRRIDELQTMVMRR